MSKLNFYHGELDEDTLASENAWATLLDDRQEYEETHGGFIH